MNQPPSADSLEQRLLDHIARPEYQPVKPRVIAKQLGISEDERTELRRTLRRLVKAGKLEFGDRHIVKPPRAKAADKRKRSADLSEAEASESHEQQTKAKKTNTSSKTEASFDSDHKGRGKDKDKDRDRTETKDRTEIKDRAKTKSKTKSDTKAKDKAKAKRKTRVDVSDEETDDYDNPRKLTRSDRGTLVGTFKRAAAGYGFVRPKDAPPGSRDQDVYISANRAADAASGDVVLVELSRGDRGDRQRGTIVEVLERETYQFVGTYYERGGTGLVQVDGRVFSQPIPVGDPGAKGAIEGDQVVIEMVRFPRHYDDGEAVITEVLGPRGAPGVDTLAIIREYDLPGEFPEAALQIAREQADAWDETIPEGRTDLTELTTITIDPVDARDFDDAISLQLTAEGHLLLGVHIADVAHFVPRDSALDVEARRRATSVYLPDRVIPMLPELISNNLASLQPNRMRFTRTVFMEYTPDGIQVAQEVVRSAIRSKRRFSYEEVDDLLANPEPWRERLEPDVFDLVLRMRDLAMVLRERRMKAGAIELSLPEIKIQLDENGRVSGAKLVENTVSHQIIEEFMLAANQSVAQILTDHGLYFLRRIHEPPTPQKLKSLTQFVRELGIACDSLESRFEIKRVIAEVRGQATEHAVNYAVLRSMQKAVYGPKEAGHFALSWDHYCHFTSPIRRYPDLDIHRMFAAIEDRKRARANRGELRALGEHCSQREQRAEAAERDLIKLKLLNYLSERLGTQMHAVITGVEEFGIFVEGIELPAEGFIAVSSLQDDYYRFDSASHSLIGYRAGHQFRLGDRLVVEVAHVDLARRELDFRLVEHSASKHRTPRAVAKAAQRPTVKKSKRVPRNKAKRRRRH